MSEDLGDKTIGKYELRERIGRGGMAEVYKAYHISLARFVALKILHPFLGEDPQFKERFEQEARNVAQLRHPNIIQVYDFDFDPQRELYYMVMEYIDGPTLRARLMQLSFQGERFSIAESIRITHDLAGALAYAHSRGMIHRDIKPGNVMFDSDGRVVLTDFGIARIISGPNVTASGSMIGTPAYMSPEQGLGQSGDHRSDIYSLGIVLYQMLTGTTPYNADTPIAIVLKHVNDPLPPPSSINPEIPDPLERVIYKALAKSPEDRYQNVEEMAAHLADLGLAAQLQLPPTTSTGTASLLVPGTLDQPSVRRGGCLGWIMLLVALLAMVAGLYVSLSGVLSSFAPLSPVLGPMLIEESPFVPDLTPTSALGTFPTAMPNTQPAQSGPPSQTSLPTVTVGVITPDLTATVQACDYDYEIIGQTPEEGSPYPALTTLTKRIRIINDSLCPLDDDARLEFREGAQLNGPDFVEFNQALQPGEEFEIVLNLETPTYNPNHPLITSTWALMLPGGLQVGPPLTFSLQIYPTGGG